MIMGGQTFTEQAVSAAARAQDFYSLDELEAYAATVNAPTLPEDLLPGQRAEWYIARNDDGTFSLTADDGLTGRELGRTDARGLPRLQQLLRGHNGTA